METVNRNAAIVAFNVLNKIPENETEFVKELSHFIYNDLSYRSPELLNSKEIWLNFDFIMKKNVKDVDVEWKKTCVDIYIGAKN